MQISYLLLNILAIPVFIAVAVVFSKDRKNIDWKSIIIVVVITLLIALFLVNSPIGRGIVQGAADAFTWIVNVSYEGIKFALPDFVKTVGEPNGGFGAGIKVPDWLSGQNFVTSALLPILLLVPLFDILTYIGILPFIIKWIGRGLSFITGRPKFEAFYSVEMMFLGNTEVIAISKIQLNKMNPRRNLTIALMSMSCITASIVGAYVGMMPAQYIITAIPLNILNAIVISSILNPVKVPKDEDVIYKVEADDRGKKQPFFAYLGDSIYGAGKLIFIITINVIAFVALADLIDALFSLTHLPWLSLENILGVCMFPFAFLLGFNVHDAFTLAQFMGTKLVTNEFVVMQEVTGAISAHTGVFSSAHFRGVLTVFVTSFANFSTVGMVTGAFKSVLNTNTKLGHDSDDFIAKNVPLMLLAGILVSLMSAAIAGLFIW